ncbi:RNA polymerase sigma factor [Longimycelium tulufanense]|uniref:RNA polymerase sigma factor n=1 Tax=Longimycelium tulufanense TaxID=907463 RepID=A0A8J3C735_9PSEU|nr:sigma-70 family RNA polymerase sigma factor [Longimycelium tulufanense]GGM46198.1 RNA polymerase sigma factor [Longimycelium tulufanense]
MSGDRPEAPTAGRVQSDVPSDAELITSVRAGRTEAFSELYNRHRGPARCFAHQMCNSTAEADDVVSEAFAKVLEVLVAGSGPDSNFRSYLLTTVRNVAYERYRRGSRMVYVDDMEGVGRQTTHPDDTGTRLERSMAAKAFDRLPERWQAVLWHTEVEGRPAGEVAPLFGLTANGVAALAYRAREGLRQAYLQVHLAESRAEQCRGTVDRLGAWARRGLSRRETAQVEAHLDKCERCRQLAAELSDLNASLRAVVAPLVLGPAAAGYLASVGAGATSGKVAATFALPATTPAGGSMWLPRAKMWSVVGPLVATASAVAVSILPVIENNPNAPVISEAMGQGGRPPNVSPIPSTPETTSPTQSSPPSPSPARDALALQVGAQSWDLTANGGEQAIPVTVRNSGNSTLRGVRLTVDLPAGVMASVRQAGQAVSSCGQPGTRLACQLGGTLSPGAALTLELVGRASNEARDGSATITMSAGSASASGSVPVRVQRHDSVQLSYDVERGFFGAATVYVKVTNTGPERRSGRLEVSGPFDSFAVPAPGCWWTGHASARCDLDLGPGETRTVPMRFSPRLLPNANVTLWVGLGSASASQVVPLDGQR